MSVQTSEELAQKKCKPCEGGVDPYSPEEARDYAALRRWAHRFYPGEEPSPIDFGYTAGGEPDPAAAGA